MSITSATKDGSTVLVHVQNDRNPGEYYTYDAVSKRAAHVLGVPRLQPTAPVAPDGMSVEQLVDRGRHPHRGWHRG